MRSLTQLLAASLVTSLLACSASSGGPTQASGPAGTDAGTATCNAACKEGETRCGEAGVETCALKDGCAAWSAGVACGAGQFCNQGHCATCDATKGSLHAQSLDVSGQERFYFLHVPASYSCDAATPLLVDYHGTAGATPEEAYGLEAAIALAEKERFILVRPRSRSSGQGDAEIYRWDQNPGDLARNVEFTRALVASLSERFHVDEKARFAFGFSSGTNMAAQFLFVPDDPFAGLGMVGGGVWGKASWQTYDARAPRIYDTTGYRDYLHSALTTMRDGLAAHGYPADRLFARETMAGHDLYDWHYREAWDWMRNGARPKDGALAAGWSKDASLATTESLTSIKRTPAGDVVVTGAQGSVWHRAKGASTWSQSQPVRSALTSACVTASGQGVAIGEGTVARTTDGGKTWAAAPQIPEFGMQQFGYSYLNGVACSSTSNDLLGGGYWAAVSSANGGESFAGVDAPGEFGATAQIASVAMAPNGTAVAVGYYAYVGHRGATGAFSPSTIGGSSQHEWFTGACATPGNKFVVTADHGGLFVSSDGGATFVDHSVAGAEDLYGVSFYDDMIGLAVGAHGAAFLTADGGATWRDVSTGLDGYLAGVEWTSDHEAIVVGEHGAVLRLSR